MAMAMTDEEYDKAMGDYDHAINQLVGDITKWANARASEGDEDAEALGFMAITWAAAGDPYTDETWGRSLSKALVEYGLPEFAARIDALLNAAPWRERPPLVERPVHPDDVRILDEDWSDDQWPEAGRAQCDDKTYTFSVPLPNPDFPPEDQKDPLRYVAARAINFGRAKPVEGEP